MARYVLKVGDGYLKGATLRSDTVTSPSKAKIFTTKTLPDKIEGRNYTYVLDKKKMQYIDQRRGMAFQGPMVMDLDKERNEYEKSLATVARNLKTGKAKKTTRYVDPFEAMLMTSESIASLELMFDEELTEDAVKAIEESIAELASSYSKLNDGNKGMLDVETPEAAQKALKDIPNLAAYGASKGMEIFVTKAVAKALLGAMALRQQNGLPLTSNWISGELVELIRKAASAYGLVDGIMKRQFDNLMLFASAWGQVMNGRIHTTNGAYESKCLRQRGYLNEALVRKADIVDIETDEEYNRAQVMLYLYGTKEKPYHHAVVVKGNPTLAEIIRYVKRNFNLVKVDPKVKNWKWGKNKIHHSEPIS